VDTANLSGDVFASVQRHEPDVVLISLDAPAKLALELTKQVARDLPRVKVLILGLLEEEEILECVEAGAHGYVLKQESLEDLGRAIEGAMRGETLCSPRIAHTLFSRLAQLAQHPPGGEDGEPLALTARQLEILRLIAQGLSNKQIANRLMLSLHTVKNHVHSILECLNVPDRAQAVEYAYQKRWLKRSQV
jgi:DNA-binding NarL/FixJ family response regulator